MSTDTNTNGLDDSSRKYSVASLALGAMSLGLWTSCSSEPVSDTAVATTVVSATTADAAPTSSPTSAVGTEQPSATETDLKAEIAAAFQYQFVAWRSCTADYDACDPASAFADVYTGRALLNLSEAIVSKEGTGRENTPSEPDTDTARIDEIILGDDILTASVAYCSVDSRTITTTGDDGTKVIVDDSVFHEQGVASYVQGDDGVWRLSQFDVQQTSSEEPICDG